MMTATVMAAVLCGALLHALWNALVRASHDRVSDIVLIVAGAGLIAGFLLPFIPLPAKPSWPYLAASALIHVGYFLLVGLAYRKGQLSFVYPIMRGAAPLASTVAVALVLSELPSLTGWLGVLLICGGIALLSIDSLRLGASKGPIGFALFNAGVIVLYTLVDGIGVRLSSHAASYTGWMFFLAALALTAIVLLRDGSAAASRFRQYWLRGLLGGACTLGSYGVALWAMTVAPIALVAALRETSVVFALIIAVVFLGERVTLMRYVSIVIVVAGMVALKFS